MMVAYYAGQVVMNTFTGISIPGFSVFAGGLIVARLSAFRMLFPAAEAHDSPEAKQVLKELEDEPTANIAAWPAGHASTAGRGRCDDHQLAHVNRAWLQFPDWVIASQRHDYFAVVGIICRAVARSSGRINAAGR